MRGRERTVFLAGSFRIGCTRTMVPLQASWTEDATIETCRVLPREAFPARYIVPAKETDPVLSAIRVTVIPLVAFRALRLPWRGAELIPGHPDLEALSQTWQHQGLRGTVARKLLPANVLCGPENGCAVRGHRGPFRGARLPARPKGAAMRDAVPTARDSPAI